MQSPFGATNGTTWGNILASTEVNPSQENTRCGYGKTVISDTEGEILSSVESYQVYAESGWYVHAHYLLGRIES